jgi:hypothetical protein
LSYSKVEADGRGNPAFRYKPEIEPRGKEQDRGEEKSELAL